MPNMFESFTLNSAFRQLGFKEVDTTLNTLHISNNVIDLSSPSSIAIVLSDVSTRNFHSGNSVSGSFYIPIDSGFGFYKNLSQNEFQQIVEFPSLTRQLKVGLLDIDTNKLISLNGSNWEMLLTKI